MIRVATECKSVVRRRGFSAMCLDIRQRIFSRQTGDLFQVNGVTIIRLVQLGKGKKRKGN